MTRYGLHARQITKVALYTGGSDGFVTSTAAPVATEWNEPVLGVGIEPRRAHHVIADKGHVSSGPPAIPEGRISRFRF